MAIIVRDNIIHIRRGDSGRLVVTIKDEEGAPYTLEDGDILYLTVREEASQDSSVVAQLTSTDGEFYFVPTDTNKTEAGKYSFDIQLTRSNGDIETVYPPVGDPKYEAEKNWKNFCIEAEVTIDGEY